MFPFHVLQSYPSKISSLLLPCECHFCGPSNVNRPVLHVVKWFATRLFCTLFQVLKLYRLVSITQTRRNSIYKTQKRILEGSPFSRNKMEKLNYGDESGDWELYRKSCIFQFSFFFTNISSKSDLQTNSIERNKIMRTRWNRIEKREITAEAELPINLTTRLRGVFRNG